MKRKQLHEPKFKVGDILAHKAPIYHEWQTDLLEILDTKKSKYVCHVIGDNGTFDLEMPFVEKSYDVALDGLDRILGKL